MFEYVVEFVKMTSDPAKFAKSLENLLNQLDLEGYEVEIKYVSEKGALVVGRTAVYEEEEDDDEEEDEVVKNGDDAAFQDAVASVFGPQGGHTTVQSFLANVMARVPSPSLMRPEDVHKTVAALCRKTPTPVLRQIAVGIREAFEHHQKTHSGSEGCAIHALLQGITESLENYLKTAVV